MESGSSIGHDAHTYPPETYGGLLTMGGILCATPPREKKVPITDLKVILRTKERDKITVTGATRVKLPRQTANDLNEAGQAAAETPLARRRRMNARISQRRGEKKKSVIQIYQGAICSCTEPAAKLLTLYQEIDDSIKTDRMVAYLMITSMSHGVT
ncbi:uncharacterized protein [Periplaneta americana]|uniref:uncharacterized protein n=1 Tax=Periplaneta americana TaxID=6978 RepID=UPI0037E7358F